MKFQSVGNLSTCIMSNSEMITKKNGERGEHEGHMEHFHRISSLKPSKIRRKQEKNPEAEYQTKLTSDVKLQIFESNPKTRIRNRSKIPLII